MQVLQGCTKSLHVLRSKNGANIKISRDEGRAVEHSCKSSDNDKINA